MRVRSFAPVADRDATRLILGSMPGVASLRAGQYYAHPRNLFWRILGELLGLDPGMPYADRVGVLAGAGIGLWDVLKSCTRAGSLDSSIENNSIEANGLATFFARHPRVRRVYFNGATAERYYRRLVLPGLPALPLEYLRLPSTSPAHAALSCRQKLEAWRQVIDRGAFPRGSA
ncbi:MAG: DNA-deoxyinosine glycosylase [Candidatus Methylomirabilia bacterium]